MKALYRAGNHIFQLKSNNGKKRKEKFVFNVFKINVEDTGTMSTMSVNVVQVYLLLTFYIPCLQAFQG